MYCAVSPAGATQNQAPRKIRAKPGGVDIANVGYAFTRLYPVIPGYSNEATLMKEQCAVYVSLWVEVNRQRIPCRSHFASAMFSGQII